MKTKVTYNGSNGRLLFWGLLLLCSAICSSVSAQDIHFSQYYSSPQNLNPSLYGNYFGTQRVILNYRRQWNTVPVSYNTFSLAYDAKLFPRELQSGVLGWGVHLNSDRAGDSKLTLQQIGSGIAYAQRLNDNNFIGLGATATYSQRRFDEQALTFDNQFNGDIFDGSLATGEQFDRNSFSYFSYDIGANWHYQYNSRNYFTISGALFHANEPVQTFFRDESIVLKHKYSLSSYANFYLSESVDFLPSVLYDMQGTYRELNYGVMGRLYLQDPEDKNALLLGAYNRWQDAIIIMAGGEFSGFRGVLSFDMNISDFRKATRSYGGVELGLSYIFNSDKNSIFYVECPYF